MYYNYTGVLWNIQRRLQQLQNINFDKKIDELTSATFVWLDEVKCIHSWPSWKMAAILDFRLTNLDLITIEMSHANVGACIIICTIHPKNANYLLHSKSVTTCPDGNVTTCPNVISLTKFVIVKKNRCTLHLATYIQGSVYSRNHEHLYIHNILLHYNV